MQSYLGEYPGSRSDSDKKFLRAVGSFINQTDKDSELIIVSDACPITHKLYHEHFKDIERIKYVYLDKDVPNMSHGKYYRGIPRQVGRSLVSGELTMYMDSDDIILPGTVDYIKKSWTNVVASNPNIDISWAQGISWIDNIKTLEFEDIKKIGEPLEGSFKIEGLGGEWQKMKMREGLRMMSTWTIVHKSDLAVKWEDTININEDHHFIKRLKENTKGFIINAPWYVRCHFRCSNGEWDY